MNTTLPCSIWIPVSVPNTRALPRIYKNAEKNLGKKQRNSRLRWQNVLHKPKLIHLSPPWLIWRSVRVTKLMVTFTATSRTEGARDWNLPHESPHVTLEEKSSYTLWGSQGWKEKKFIRRQPGCLGNGTWFIMSRDNYGLFYIALPQNIIVSRQKRNTARKRVSRHRTSVSRMKGRVILTPCAQRIRTLENSQSAMGI